MTDPADAPRRRSQDHPRGNVETAAAKIAGSAWVLLIGRLSMFSMPALVVLAGMVWGGIAKQLDYQSSALAQILINQADGSARREALESRVSRTEDAIQRLWQRQLATPH